MSGDKFQDQVGFLYKTMVERDPKKRRVKPVQQSLVDFDLGESSDDSDFRIEDHEESDDDDSLDTDDDAGCGKTQNDDDDDDEDDGDEEDTSNPEDPVSMQELLRRANEKQSVDLIPGSKVVVCCACLGDRSDGMNEIVECDGCGVSVHEGCYGVTDSASVSSTISSCSTEPWFCEPCKAGMDNPTCELCPNSGGIFKETDVGKWVHLVCALYVPGVAFGEVDKLSSVTLFEMSYSRWGAKPCSLCEDERYGRTGVCIGCDAGMCRTYFHVTCAQREGLLSEAHSEEVDQADPFYAHCKLHTDKMLMRRRRRNWLALHLQIKQRQLKKERLRNGTEVPADAKTDQQRILRKLQKHHERFVASKALKPPPWVPTQKMPRLLTTSASACKKLLHKAELMGIDTQALEIQEAQAAALVDIRKKWHIPPAFSVEFISYYLDRNMRMTCMKQHLEELLDQNSQLQEEQQALRDKYDQLVQEHSDEDDSTGKMKELVEKYHRVVKLLVPQKELPAVEKGKHLSMASKAITKKDPKVKIEERPGVKSSRVRNGPQKACWTFNNFESDALPTSLLNECGICRQLNDQHLLAKCDTCHKHYHLGCLTPPLTRMPKKTKLMGWQCSECDKESSPSEPENVDTEAPRKLRQTIKEPCKFSPVLGSPMSPKILLEKLPDQITSSEKERKEKKKKEKRKRKAEKLKRKKILDGDSDKHLETDAPRIKIKIKPIPLPVQPAWEMLPETPRKAAVLSSLKRARDTDVRTSCDVCHEPGVNDNLVRCDECKRCFHFACLDPPVKKSPKPRGYSWHCADCDPTDEELPSDN